MSGAPLSMTTSIEAVNPDKYRLVSTSAGMEAMIIVNDGHSIWMYMPMFKRYSKTPASANTLDTLAAEFGAGDAQESTANAHVPETLEIDGQPHDCWVVEPVPPTWCAPFGSTKRLA
jgi:outer membrane lipoprotein-sorting protein